MEEARKGGLEIVRGMKEKSDGWTEESKVPFDVRTVAWEATCWWAHPHAVAIYFKGLDPHQQNQSQESFMPDCLSPSQSYRDDLGRTATMP